jgi:perosamine synthetase
MSERGRLAIDGGTPAVRFPIPQWSDRTGRSMGREERRLVLEVLDSGHLGMVGGEKVRLLQKEWAAAFGVPVAVATNSGSSALHTAMIFLCVGPGDEVLVPAATDMGTVIAVLLQNAVPVFVDVQPDTMNIDPDDLERKITPRSKAVIPVHMFGFPADMDRVMAIAERHGLMVVEDCARRTRRSTREGSAGASATWGASASSRRNT